MKGNLPAMMALATPLPSSATQKWKIIFKLIYSPSCTRMAKFPLLLTGIQIGVCGLFALVF